VKPPEYEASGDYERTLIRNFNGSWLNLEKEVKALQRELKQYFDN